MSLTVLLCIDSYLLMKNLVTLAYYQNVEFVHQNFTFVEKKKPMAR